MDIKQEDMQEIARDVVARVQQSSHGAASVITLKGDLGAGKTTLSQSIARALGITESVISPTFVIMKRYQAAHPYFTQLIHIDAYRLKDSSELGDLGFKELLFDPHTLILIEWPEQVPDSIPKDAFQIELTHKDDTMRTIRFDR